MMDNIKIDWEKNTWGLDCPREGTSVKVDNLAK
jgi:hypothetical protein